MDNMELVEHYRRRAVLYKCLRNIVIVSFILGIVTGVALVVLSLFDEKNLDFIVKKVNIFLYLDFQMMFICISSNIIQLFQNKFNIDRFRKAGLEKYAVEQETFFNNIRNSSVSYYMDIACIATFILVILFNCIEILRPFRFVTMFMILGTCVILLAMQGESLIRASHDALISYHRQHYDLYVKPLMYTENTCIDNTDETEFAEINLKKSGMIPIGTDIDIWGILNGTYNDRRLTMGKVCSKIYGIERVPGSRYDYQQELTAKILFTGSFMGFSCSAKVNNAIVVYSRNYRKKLYPYELKKAESIRTGDTEFDRMFIIKSHNSEEAQQIFTDEFRAAMLEYMQMNEGDIGMVINYKMAFIISNSLYAGICPPGLRAIDDMEERQRLNAVLANNVKLIERLNL